MRGTSGAAINIGWPRAEVYDPAGGSWFLQYFVAFTLAVGYVAYRVVKDRDGAPDPPTPWSARRSSSNSNDGPRPGRGFVVA